MNRQFLTLTILWIIYSLPINSYAQPVTPYAPELFSEKISISVCGFSKNGKIIYYVKEDTVSKKLFLYQANRKAQKWTNEMLLSFSGHHNDYGGRFNKDKSVFYFTSDRPKGSKNEKDLWNLWMVRRRGDSWESPEPLFAVNEKGNECCPVALPDGSLLFSSDRGSPQEWWMFSLKANHDTIQSELTNKSAWQWPSSFDEPSQILFFNSMKRSDTFGMDDIYVSFFQDGRWKKVVNVGDTINTSAYEDGAILSPDRKFLIFCRHKTATTPSQVLCVPWESLLKKLKAVNQN